ncbi:hypothetical protein L9F63_025825, partial [Diploptera punctata]
DFTYDCVTYLALETIEYLSPENPVNPPDVRKLSLKAIIMNYSVEKLQFSRRTSLPFSTDVITTSCWLKMGGMFLLKTA